MFKAPIKVASHNAISNKDRKTLKKDLTKNFPTDVIDMIFINSSDISATKLTGSPIVIYSDEEAPLFIDSTANADFFPTIYGVDLYPDIVRSLYLKEGVEAFILKGANLMWPGVDKISEITGDMNQDDVVAIRRAGNNEVVAIGALACDPESVKNSEKPDGIACYILHIEGDSLWGAGAKAHLKPKWDRKIQEQKEQEQLAKLQKKEKKKQEADEEEEDENESNLLGFINKREHTAVDMSKGKVKQLPKDLKTGGTESKASKGTAPAKGGKDKDEKGKGKDKDDEKKGKVAKGKDDKGKGKDKDDDKKGKGGKKDDKKGGDKKKDDKKDKKKDDKKDNKKKQESESEGEEEEDNDEEEGEEDEEVEEMTEKKGKVETEATTVTQEGEDEDSDEDWKTGGKGKGAKKAPAKGNAKESTKDKDEDGVSKEDMKKMDEEIMAAFLNACKISITDKDLPIELGKLWTNFIVKCRTDPNEELDFKLSSYKKIGKFIQHLQKEKLLTYEEASKKNPVPKVTKIELHHKKVLDWAPTVSARDLDDRDKENEKDDQKENSWRVQVEITKLYKPNDSVKVFLDGAAGPMTKVEAEKKFSTWLKSNNLIEKDSVIYNDQLFNKFGIIEDEGSDEEEEEGEMGDKGAKVKAKTKKGERQSKVSRQRLFEVFCKCLQEVHEIRNLKTKAVEVKGSAFRDIQLTADKAHNKFITRLSGLEPFQVDVEKLNSFFQNKFATSATISELPGKIPVKEITIQGTFIDEIEDFLKQEMGIPENLINLNNKIAKKKAKSNKIAQE